MMKKFLLPLIIMLFFSDVCNAESLSQSIAKQLQTKINLIAIDPGFGGSEHGPSGCDGTAVAKDINLKISKKVSEKLRNELGIEVVLTREIDTYLSPEERTDFVNTKDADILISIHTNGSTHFSASGIETYVLNLVSDSKAVRVAAMENSTSSKNIADMEMILQNLMSNAKVSESGLLAENVQKYLCKHINGKYKKIKNRGVKQAPFYMLLGAEMPSIMIHTGFITNPDECNQLRTDEYQEDISIGIIKGVRAYMEERKSTQPPFSP
jgi:N-acetylmuramoyl-L-alanine amidase